MANKTISLLERVIGIRDKKTRLTNLLANPVKGDLSWYMYVPPCFNDAMDIRLTDRKIHGEKKLTWTQGPFFSFDRGDTLYDTQLAYQEWAKALEHISLCISIRNASPVITGPKGSPRNPGKVFFEILVPNDKKTQLVKLNEHVMNQNDFVRFLVIGPMDQIHPVQK